MSTTTASTTMSAAASTAASSTTTASTSYCSVGCSASASRNGVGCTTTRCSTLGVTRGSSSSTTAVAYCRSTTCVATRSATCISARSTTTVSAIGCETASAVIPSASTIDEAMATPAVVIAPAGPGAHAQEDAVIEIARSIEPIGRAGIGGIVVVAIGTDRLFPYAYNDLRLG